MRRCWRCRRVVGAGRCAVEGAWSGFVDGGGAAQPAVGAGGDQAADDVGLRLSDAEGDGAAAAGEAGAGSGSCSGGAKAGHRRSDGGVGSHRDRGDELPSAERSDEPGELLGAAGERGRGRGPAAERAGAGSCCGDWRRPRGAWRKKAASSTRWRIRRRVLRHLAARGARDGPAAAVAAGSGVGGVGACGHRPESLSGSRTGVYVGVDRRATMATRSLEDAVDVERNGPGVERAGGPGCVRPRPRGPGDDGGHGVLVVAGGAASGVRGAAGWRVRSGAGRRRDGDVDARGVRGVRSGSSGLAPDGRCKAFSDGGGRHGVGGRRAAYWCWSGCPTPSATATGCSP